MSENQVKDISILLVEDNKGDARLIHEMFVDQEGKGSILSRYHLEWEKSIHAATAALNKKAVDIILLDLTLPDSSGLDTFKSIREHAGQIPIIVMSGLNDEKIAVDAVREGAQDYLVKGTVNSSLLARSIWYAIERKSLELEKEKLINELEEALSKVKTLSGLIPICANCKKVRDDEGYWNQVEVYIQNHSEAEFTHSYCPDCLKKLYPELVDENGKLKEAVK
ncbi:response regulator [bacterium]|nr:response regulator [bacterium]